MVRRICYMNKDFKFTIPKAVRDKYDINYDAPLELLCTQEGLLIKFPKDIVNQKRTKEFNDDRKELVNKVMRQDNHKSAKPLPRHMTKCSLCGYTKGLTIYKEAAYCTSCIERVKDLEKKGGCKKHGK